MTAKHKGQGSQSDQSRNCSVGSVPVKSAVIDSTLGVYLVEEERLAVDCQSCENWEHPVCNVDQFFSLSTGLKISYRKVNLQKANFSRRMFNRLLRKSSMISRNISYFVVSSCPEAMTNCVFEGWWRISTVISFFILYWLIILLWHVLIIAFWFVGESMAPDGMLALMKWEEETPYMYFFKHGLDEEKVVSRILFSSALDIHCL